MATFLDLVICNFGTIIEVGGWNYQLKAYYIGFSSRVRWHVGSFFEIEAVPLVG
jgi:hypothetical protein